MTGEEAMTTNEDRAIRVEEILALYPEDQRTNLIDLCADAMHWCDLNDKDFDDILRIARIHFEAEKSEEA
jgi:hypothetical protein